MFMGSRKHISRPHKEPGQNEINRNLQKTLKNAKFIQEENGCVLSLQKGMTVRIIMTFAVFILTVFSLKHKMTFGPSRLV